MGRFLATAGSSPDHAITSTATRARQTLAIAAEHGGWTGQATVTDTLYGASPDDVLRVLHQAPEDADTVVVVGHEPTFSRTISRLIGGGAIEVKTATMARVDVDVLGWEDVAFGRGTLVWLLSPGFLKPNRYRKLQQAVKDVKEGAEKAAEIIAPKPKAEAGDPASGS